MEKTKIFMKPGKNNREDRMNFIKFWAEYIKTHSDKEWSMQQNKLINSQLKSVKQMKPAEKKNDFEGGGK